MSFIIDKSSREPAYIRLYEHIKNNIINGVYPHGSKIPSKRVMAAETGVSEITVKHSYGLLCDEGYLESSERSGFYVSFSAEGGFAVSQTQSWITKGKKDPKSNSIELAFPFSVITKTVRRILNEYAESVLQKSPNQGCIELRRAIQQYLARNRNIFIEENQIVIGSGAEYLYSMVAKLFGHNKIFGLESPSYEKIEKVYRIAGARCELLPLGTDGIESAALANSKADIIHISPYRSFPTGITASASKRYEYVRWAKKNGRFIVEDDFESEFSVSSKPEETVFALSDDDNVIYMNTFSKTISPSLRIGYMILPKRLLRIFEYKLGFFSCTVPTFDQLVLARLISCGDFERHINRIRRQKRKAIVESKQSF